MPDQVIFRNDFPAWLRTRTERDRRVAQDLMVGERTKNVARKFGMSPGRVSQLRRDFHEDWQRFEGDLNDDGTSHTLSFRQLMAQDVLQVRIQLSILEQ